MRIFIEYSQGDYKRLQEHTADTVGGLSSLVLRGIIKLGQQDAKKRCPNRCKKIKRQYKIPASIANRLKVLAENEGVSVAMLVQKRVVHPLIHTTATLSSPPETTVCSITYENNL